MAGRSIWKGMIRIGEQELRTPESVGLEPLPEPEPAVQRKIERAVRSLTVDELPTELLIDEDAERMHALVESRADAGEATGKLDKEQLERAEVVDLIDILKERLKIPATQ